MAKLLIVDDDLDLIDMLSNYFLLKGYEIYTAYDGKEALDKMKYTPDLVILDVNMPKLNGIDVCKRIRDFTQSPILFLTARATEEDKVNGLLVGGDDYIVKPFAIEELLARLRALLRRIDIEGDKNVAKQTTITYRDLTIEKENRVVRRNSEMIELTKREYELLLTLMENVNVVLARDVLLNKVWGYETEVETNVVDVYIRYLRNKIDVPGEESYIQTVRGTGYVMRSWELINEKND